MQDFNIFLEELMARTGVRFRLVDADGEVLFNGLKEEDNGAMVNFTVLLGDNIMTLHLPEKFNGAATVLKYVIESRFRELYSIKEQGLIEIIEGREILHDIMIKNFSFVEKGCNVILIYVNGSKIDALNVIKEIYKEQEVISIIYGDYIVMIGCFEDIEEHCKSIIESIEADAYCDSFVSYSSAVYKVSDIKRAYKNSKECLFLKDRFSLKQNILSYNKLLFEKVVYSINKDLKRELKDYLEHSFNSFDDEILTTIEEFISCGLNISDAARRLYIHRNTLIYRLDKIKKETGYDIRNFKEATLFIIAYLVWKEKSK